MALTLEAEQRLENVGLVQLFKEHKKVWLTVAKESKSFAKGSFPSGSRIRQDDVAKVMHPVLEVNETLQNALSAHKLRGKFWIRDFGDLIIDRTWDELSKEEQS